MKKRVLAIGLAVMMAFGLPACGSDDAKETTKAAAETTEEA